MTVKLTPEYIESLINNEEFHIQPEIIICKLTVGESVFVGEAHCFDTAVQNVTRGKESARKHAINRIFDAEAYHLKRERDKLNRKHGIHALPIYEVVRKQGGCIRLTNISAAENHIHKDIYSFTFVDPYGNVVDEAITIDRHLNVGVDVQLQQGLRILCLKDRSETKPTGMGRNYVEQYGEGSHLIDLNIGNSDYKLPNELITALNLTGNNEKVSPSEYEGDSRGETKKANSTSIHESSTSNNHRHSHNSSNNSTGSENSSSTDSGDRGTSD